MSLRDTGRCEDGMRHGTHRDRKNGHPVYNLIRNPAGISVGFRSAKARLFAERKATIQYVISAQRLSTSLPLRLLVVMTATFRLFL